MKNNWKQGTFNNLIEEIVSGDWGKNIPTNNYMEQVYCVRGADLPSINVGTFGKMPIRYIPTKNYFLKRLSVDDLIIEISGGSPTQSTGRIGKISRTFFEKFSKIICSNFCKAIKVKKGYSDFFYYSWQNLYIQNKFFMYENGTTGIKNLNISDFLNTEVIKIPSLLHANKISKILRTFDDKIELNNKINENLEQQAQAIFKSWFIDFEPFGGKMPNDWEKGTFSELIDYAIGGDWGKEKLQDNYTEKVYCIRGADIPDVRNGNKGKMPFRYILPKNYENKKLSNGDLVVEISGGSPTQSTGRIAVITDYLLNRYDNKIVCTNFCRALKPKKDYSMFIYYYWLYMYSKDVFFSYENGTTGIKNFDITGFLETEKIVIPNEEVLKKFSNLCISFEKQIFSNGYENEQLANLRDTLLPKLMNGEIDVEKIKI